MKALLVSILLFGFICASAQEVGPPNNVGREYGNPKMPLMVSHLAGANKERLKRANKNSHHSIFGKVLCFRKLCRIQSGHSSSLHAVSFKKHRKNVAKNAKKGAYHKPLSTPSKPVTPDTVPAVVEPVTNKPVPVTKAADSLIVLGAELLFETNKATLRSEHFATLKSIVDYLHQHPERSVKISGHTDNIGDETQNLTLSRKRADVVADYLVKNGVNTNRVETFGLGSAKPIDANTTDAGRKKNRRVELLIYDRE
ncbi:OmpA family protein [Chryseolinea sp. T2]|uniref:OmpA family protein n=1 Tax=Chryseolinea sp. T2 TaxID=3129255 RepID=UPI0030777B72